MNAERKTYPIVHPKAKDAETQTELKQRWGDAKKAAVARGAQVTTDGEFLAYLLDHFEGNQNTSRITAHESNLNNISKLIDTQMKLNQEDESTSKLKNGKVVYVNKRRITSSWVQNELGCSFNAISVALGTKDEPTELARQIEKHHEKCGIGEHHNRAVLRAKTSLDKGQAVLNGEVLNIKELAGIA